MTKIDLDSAKNFLNPGKMIKISQAHKNYKHIHIWFPNIFEFQGGIQVYSAFFLQALQYLYPNSKYNIFIKNDTCCLSNVSLIKDTRFHFTGKWHLKLRTLAFATQILGYGIWQRPSLVIAAHIHFTIAAYLLKCLFGIPYWTIAHGLEAWNIQRPTLKLALQNADCILVGSNYTRDRLLKEQELDPNKVLVLANTFDANLWRIGTKPNVLLKRYALNHDQPIILTVARLSQSEQYKGYDKILAALPQIRQAIPNIHYILVGKGDDRPRIEELINKLQLQECVTLTGYVPDEELGDYYNLCDVFVMSLQCRAKAKDLASFT